MLFDRKPATGTTPKATQLELLARNFALALAIAALINVLYFIVKGAASPVLQADDWYFLDVFVRKAIEGNLSFADFFVKRNGIDHAQPLVKGIIWVEWRFLHLDVAVESIVGAISAALCGCLAYRFIVASRSEDGRNPLRYLAWGATCVVLLSLNSTHVWTWPLVAVGYLTILVELLFVWAIWHAWSERRCGLLVLATLFLVVTTDDGAEIVIISTLFASVIVLARDSTLRDRHSWKPFAIIIACLLIARIGYQLAPIVGGGPAPSLTHLVRPLLKSFRTGGARWVVDPLALSVAYQRPFEWISEGGWKNVGQWVIALLLVVAHIAFWRRAFRREHNLTTFAAISIMLMTYAWVVGIIVYRVSINGNDYFYQPRYVQLYGFNLVALLLMLASRPSTGDSHMPKHWLWAVVSGCVVLIALQVPYTIKAWRLYPYLLKYQQKMAGQLRQLASDPSGKISCVPELVVCQSPVAVRVREIELLRSHQLNVFSPVMQRWYPQLRPVDAMPQLASIATGVASATVAPALANCSWVPVNAPAIDAVGVSEGVPAWSLGHRSYLRFRSDVGVPADVEIGLVAVAGRGVTVSVDGGAPYRVPTEALPAGKIISLPVIRRHADGMYTVEVDVKYPRLPGARDHRLLGIAVTALRICGPGRR